VFINMFFVLDSQDKQNKSEARQRMQKNLFFETSDVLLDKLADRNDIEECNELNLGDRNEN